MTGEAPNHAPGPSGSVRAAEGTDGRPRVQPDAGGGAMLAGDLDHPPADIRTTDLELTPLRALVQRDPAAFRRLCLRLAQWPIVTHDDIDAITAYLSRGPMSVIDPDCGVSGELAHAFKEKLGLERRHAITFNSATNALHAAYRSVGVGPGVQVAAIGYTFHATVTPILDLGGSPVLMDVDPQTGNLTYDEVRRTLDINPGIAAVAMNHNWGLPCRDIARIAEHLASRGIPLIEDCSHAHGASVDGVSVGARGTISVFSLQSKKLVPGGEGGLCFTDDVRLKSAMLLVGHYFSGLKSHGVEVDESVMQTGVGGLQCRIHPVAAVMALSQLQRLDRVISNRRANEDRLRSLLGDVQCISFPEPPAGTEVSHYACRAKYDEGKAGGVPIESFVASLRRHGVPVERDRGGPLSRKSIYQSDVATPVSRFDPRRRKYSADDLPNATTFCERSLIFPVYSRDPEVVSDLIDVIAEQCHRTGSGFP